jgi:hypothetical protein
VAQAALLSKQRERWDKGKGGFSFNFNIQNQQLFLALITKHVSALMRIASVGGVTELVQSISQLKPVINKYIKPFTITVQTAGEFLYVFLKINLEY